MAAIFAARISASHGLSLYLAWLAFTEGSAALGGAVLAVRALLGFCVPLLVGRLHDRDRILPWLRVASVVEAGAAIAVAWLRGTDSSTGWVLVVLSLLLGITSSLFDTAVFPLLLAARPGRLKAHVLMGLAFDVAKVAASSVVLALLSVWSSPVPVMIVCSLSLVGWRLTTFPTAPEPQITPEAAVSRSARGGGAALTALGMVALLPGQLIAYQTLLADGSFRSYAVLGTVFAVGAILGNLLLQRAAVTAVNIAVSYLVTGAGLLVALRFPSWGLFCFGAGTAAYYQLTRALVVAAAPPERRGRAAGRLAAVSKLTGVLGAAAAAAAFTHPDVMVALGAAVCFAAAAVVGASHLHRQQQSHVL
jgi:MFS family permease